MHKRVFSYLNDWKGQLSGIFLCMLCITLSGCQQRQKNEEVSKIFPKDYPVLHPRFREWPVPGNNIEVLQSSPSLMWPATRKKGIRYAIRLSTDSVFPDSHTIYAKNIPWTVFNPHRSLKRGTWYWQYRVQGHPWSGLLKFRISGHADTTFPPPFSAFRAGIPVSHPRVFIDQKDRQAFVSEVRGSKAAAIIIKEADTYLDKPMPKETTLPKINKEDYRQVKLYQRASKHLGFEALDAMKALCKAYILTGANKYADKGKALALHVAGWDPDGLSGFEDFGDGASMLTMALGFDTFNNTLDSSEKKSLLKNINIRGERFYHDWVNTVDAKVLSNHVWQFILHYFFRTALAVEGSSSYADKWLNYMYELWLARSPVLGRSDGGWAGGLSYFTINISTLLDVPMVIREYTGYDFIRHNPWYRNSAYWIYYAFPPASSSDGFGDNTERLTAPKGYFLAYADALSKLNGNRVAATYAHKIERNADIHLYHTPVLRWFRLRYLRDLQRPDTLADGTLPSAMAFPDEGLVEMHSSISNPGSDLMVAMRSSPFGSYGHMLADQNTFNIMYGGQRIFYMSGQKVTMKDPLRLKWYKATIGHNGILINGKGQPFGPAAYGWIPRFMNGKNLTYAVGDASMAYFQGTVSDKKPAGGKNLKHFRRHILFLQPNIVVIYDVLQAAHASTWSWLLHSPQHLYLDSTLGEFYCHVKGATATCAFFSSSPVSWKLKDTVRIPGAGSTLPNKNIGITGSHLTAATLEKTHEVRFFTVIKVDSSKAEKVEFLPVDNNNKGILIGNWEIFAEMDTTKYPVIKAYNKDKKVAFTSNGKLRFKDKVFGSDNTQSAKLAEFINGKWTFKEVADQIPTVVKGIPGSIQN